MVAENISAMGSEQRLWEGPSKLITIRTSKNGPMKSLLKSTYKEPTGMGKQHREGPVHLDRLGLEADEHAFAVHGGPEKAVLQYNIDHYQGWKQFFKDIRMVEDGERDKLLSPGGFGENIAVENVKGVVPMDESSICIGDLVAFYKPNNGASDFKMLKSQARMRVTGPRLPCFKLNHRFGVPNMSQRAQDKFWTGWLYSIDAEGDVEVGDVMVLLERPFPQWPVARIQHYLFKEPKNLDMIKQALDTLGEKLVFDVKNIFESRLTKGTEDMKTRLQGEEQKDNFAEYRLRQKIRQTTRVSEFVLERVPKLPLDSNDFMVAKSGSHVRLKLNLEGGSTVIRPYSIIQGNSNTFHLGVALADRSRGGSVFLHRNLKIGDIVECSDKFTNTFPLVENKGSGTNHVFLAGGIGITAFLDHMKRCLETKQKFHLHYMIRNRSDCAFESMIKFMLNNIKQDNNKKNNMLPGSDPTDSDSGSESESESGSYTDSTLSSNSSLETLSTESRAQISTYVSAEGKRCDLKAILSEVAADTKAHIYVCGSEKMGDNIRAISAGLKIPDSRIHFEEFAVDGGGDPFVAELTHTKKKIEVGTRQTLLEALRDTGLEIPSMCEAGSCGTCKVRVKCGRVQHKGTGLEETEKAGYNGSEEGEILTCVSRGIGTIALEV